MNPTEITPRLSFNLRGRWRFERRLINASMSSQGGRLVIAYVARRLIGGIAIGLAGTAVLLGWPHRAERPMLVLILAGSVFCLSLLTEVATDPRNLGEVGKRPAADLEDALSRIEKEQAGKIVPGLLFCLQVLSACLIFNFGVIVTGVTILRQVLTTTVSAAFGL